MNTRRTVATAAGASALLAAALLVPVQAHGAGGTSFLLHQIQLRGVSLASEDRFGSDVAAAGPTVVIGASRQGSGAVYVYTRPKHGWHAGVKPIKLTAVGLAADADFGRSVAVEGSTIVVGADNQTVGSNEDQGAVYVFTEPRHGWRSTSHPTATLTVKGGTSFSDLGLDVAISGSTIVSGSLATVDGNVLEGAAYVFTEPKSGWTSEHEAATLTDSAGQVDEAFAASVGISGSTVVAGVFGHPGTGVAEIFVEPKHGWHSMTQTRTLVGKDTAAVDEFGHSVAIFGRTVAVGSSDHEVDGNADEGAVYVFTEPKAGWGHKSTKLIHQTAELTSDDGAMGDGLGYGIALFDNAIVAGADDRSVGANRDQGVLYGFIEPATGWKNEHQAFELSTSNGAAFDTFGQFVAVTPGLVVGGGPDANNETGQAYLFAQPGPAINTLSQSHSSWPIGIHPPKTNPKQSVGGTTFTVAVDEPATVTMAFAEMNAHHKFVPRGTITVKTRTGRLVEYVDGPLGHGHSLAVGTCKVAVIATSDSGISTTKTLHFTVKA